MLLFYSRIIYQILYLLLALKSVENHLMHWIKFIPVNDWFNLAIRVYLEGYNQRTKKQMGVVSRAPQRAVSTIYVRRVVLWEAPSP